MLGRADQGRLTWAGGLGSEGGAAQVRQTIKVLKYLADVEQAEKAGVVGSGSINIGDLELIETGHRRHPEFQAGDHWTSLIQMEWFDHYYYFIIQLHQYSHSFRSTNRHRHGQTASDLEWTLQQAFTQGPWRASVCSGLRF